MRARPSQLNHTSNYSNRMLEVASPDWVGRSLPSGRRSSSAPFTWSTTCCYSPISAVSTACACAMAATLNILSGRTLGRRRCYRGKLYCHPAVPVPSCLPSGVRISHFWRHHRLYLDHHRFGDCSSFANSMKRSDRIPRHRDPRPSRPRSHPPPTFCFLSWTSGIRSSHLRHPNFPWPSATACWTYVSSTSWFGHRHPAGCSQFYLMLIRYYCWSPCSSPHAWKRYWSEFDHFRQYCWRRKWITHLASVLSCFGPLRLSECHGAYLQSMQCRHLTLFRHFTTS